MRSKIHALCVSAAVLSFALAGVAAGQSLLHPETMPRMKPGPPVTYGTSQTSYVSIPEWEFSPISSASTYSDEGVSGLNAVRFGTGGDPLFLAPLHLPSGAILMSVEFDLCDSNALSAHDTGAMESCAKVDGLCAILGTPVMSVSDAVNPCAAYVQDLSSLNYVVDNTAARPFVAVVTPALDNTNAFTGAVVGYRLQVSPAPATADFADVPTSHPFFQFVEALYHSGITAGCGGGNFCPDNPLTRGQMAVFLSKALGLQFP
jgi:hypothetical protein